MAEEDLEEYRRAEAERAEREAAARDQRAYGQVHGQDSTPPHTH